MINWPKKVFHLNYKKCNYTEVHEVDTEVHEDIFFVNLCDFSVPAQRSASAHGAGDSTLWTDTK
jgi:hypothetical protein